jgi:5,10-methylenetetrahydromethanopterin reductase
MTETGDNEGLPATRPLTARWGLSLEELTNSPDGEAGLAATAERLGYSDVWNGEESGADGVVTMAAAAIATSRVGLGTGILNVYSRSPMLLAMAAASLQELSGGRFCLGLGTSSRRMVEDWHGMSFDHPLARMRGVVDVVRRLLAGERVDREGDTRIRKARLAAPPSVPVPIYLAALGPAMLRLAGEIADGVVLNLMPVGDLEWMLAEVHAGMDKAPEPKQVRTVLKVLVPYPGDDDRAIDAMRDLVAYCATAPVYRNLLERVGFSRQVKASLECRAAGDRVGTRGAIDDKTVEALAIVGSVDQQRLQIAQYVDAGADVPVLTFFHGTKEPEEMRALTREAAHALAPVAER